MANFGSRQPKTLTNSGNDSRPGCHGLGADVEVTGDLAECHYVTLSPSGLLQGMQSGLACDFLKLWRGEGDVGYCVHGIALPTAAASLTAA